MAHERHPDIELIVTVFRPGYRFDRNRCRPRSDVFELNADGPPCAQGPENGDQHSIGGGTTNVIAGDSTVQVEVRAGDVDVWRDLKRRVLACFGGAAIATGCTWTHRQTEHPYAPIDTHAGLGGAWDANMEAVGRPVDTTPIFGGGSSDMGNVSQVVPSVHGGGPEQHGGTPPPKLYGRRHHARG